MKTVRIDGETILIYEDGSIKIPHNGMQLCLDWMDIELMYKESYWVQNCRESIHKDTD